MTFRKSEENKKVVAKVVDLLDFDIWYLSNPMSDWNKIFSFGFCRQRPTTYPIIKEIWIIDLANCATLKCIGLAFLYIANLK